MMERPLRYTEYFSVSPYLLTLIYLNPQFLNTGIKFRDIDSKRQNLLEDFVYSQTFLARYGNCLLP
jgi:hypothetical protein